LSLNNLGNRLSNLGRLDEALAASQEAVAIRRRLAENHPNAFLPNLARSLGGLGQCCQLQSGMETRPSPSTKDWQ